MNKAPMIRYEDLSELQQYQLRRATRRLIYRAMSDPALWARVQERKEEMYRDGRLKREEAV